jgi:DNA polymerase-1
MNQSDKLFLLDAYALIYRAYYALIKNPRLNSKGMNTSAIMGFVNTLEDVLRNENPSYIGIAFDPSGKTFRHKLYPDYKAQRQATPEVIRQSIPIIKDIIRAYNIPILESAGFEADDVIGTLSKKADEKGIFTYMVTPDKDYAQLVGNNVVMYRPQTAKGFELLDEKKVLEKYSLSNPSQVIDLLGLMGDSSDNIPGCPGVGEKTAQKLIKEFGSIETLLKNTNKLTGALQMKVENNKEQIAFSKYLATIRTDVPIELNLEELKRKPVNEEEIKSIFDELEFRNLLARVLKTPEKLINKEPRQGDLFADFQEDVPEKTIQTTLASVNDSKKTYKLIDKEDDIFNLVNEILTFQTISLDTETTSTNAINAELVGMSFSFKENEAYYIPIPADRDKAQKIVDVFRPVFENEQSLKVGQNIKYDMQVLQNYGISLKGKIFDTMIAHYVMQPEMRHNMDYLAEVYLNYKTVHIEELIGEKGKNQKNMRDLDPKNVYVYAAEDADITFKLYHILVEELKKNDAEKVFYEVEMPLVPVLANIERNGVRIDTDSLKQSAIEFTRRLNEIETTIYELAGTSFNIASPKQVGEILFERLKVVEKAKKTKTGQYVTSEEVLQNLHSKHPIIAKILEYRGLKKLLTTYIDALPQMINPRTNRIHTSFNQTVTATGRLSSSNPNLQNIPVRDEDGKEIRKAFIPDDGCLFFSADYSQIELRIMAHLSKDENMIAAFSNNEDIHAATAAKIYHIDLDAVTKEMRRKAKTANFGIIYGISVFGLAERMEVDRKEAKELIEEYFKTYPKVKQYMDHSIEVAKENGYVETIFHRKRYLPDINSKNGIVRGYAERNAINAPIQGIAADIIKVAMARIFECFQAEGLRSKMILQVHDELNFSVYPEEKEAVERIVIREMDNAYKMSVPLKADCGWGNNWLEAH